MNPRPLEGRLVLELGTRSSVSTCGGLLAQFGARVVVVEPRAPRGDDKWAERATAMLGKQSICLAEEDNRDRELIERLLAAADVVLLSSDRPGALSATAGPSCWSGGWGAHQIVCDLTAFGHRGPLAGIGASELQVQAVGGIMDITGRSDGPPLPVGVPVLETSAAVYGAGAVLAATRVQRLHGMGQKIDIALFDAAVNALSSFLAVHFGGGSASRIGNGHALTSPWGAYPGQDGFVVLCTMTSEQFQRVCNVIGRGAVAKEERFASSPERRKHAAFIDALISDWTSRRSVAESIAAFSAVEIPCGAIVTAAELETEPNLAHRRMLRELCAPDGGRTRLAPASPLRSVPAVTVDLERVPPPDGDRDSVLRELEGRSSRSLPVPTGPSDAAVNIRPMDGVRIVEIGQYTLAPFATRQMSALGADVLKIESPRGDALRKAGVGASKQSQIFAMLNTDKRGLVLDLSEDADRHMLHQLLAQSDVLVENLKPGTLAGFGFSTEVLRRRHPRLVYCALSGFGQDSAYPGRAAFDTVVQAMSGLMSATRENGLPFKAGISASDLAGSQFGMLAILAGTEARDLTGVAPHFDIAMHDATAWLTTVHSSVSDAGVTHRIVQCDDGHALVEGAPPWIEALGSRSFPGSRSRFVEEAVQKGLRAAPILSVAEVVQHPQTAARDLLIRRASPSGEEQLVLNCPFALCGTPPRVDKVMAALGADSESVATQFGLRHPSADAGPFIPKEP